MERGTIWVRTAGREAVAGVVPVSSRCTHSRALDMPESWCSLPLARHVPVKERLWPEGCGCAAVMSCGGVWIRPATASVRTEPYPLWPFAKPSAERVRRNCGGCERIALGPYGPYKSSYTRSARPGGPYLLRGTSSLIITRYCKLRGEIKRLVQRSRYPSVDTTDIAVRGRETRRRRQFPHGAGRKTAAWWKLGRVGRSTVSRPQEPGLSGCLRHHGCA